MSISVRNISQGGPTVKHFKGVLLNIQEQLSENFNKPTATLLFTDLEIIELMPDAAPYTEPVLSVYFSNVGPRGDRWVIFAKSVVKHLAKDQDIDALVGRRLELDYKSEHSVFNGESKKREPASAWELVSIEGGANAVRKTAEDVAKELLDGKTVDQFFQAALGNADIIRDANLFKRIRERTFGTELIGADEFALDGNGVYRRLAVVA